MEDRLSGAGARVDDRAIAGLAQAAVIGYTSSDTEQMPQQGFVPLRCVVERLNVFQRDHEHMSGRLRVDVANDDAAIVLMDKLCGNVAGYYFAEEAVVVGHDLIYRIAISYPRISSTLT